MIDNSPFENFPILKTKRLTLSAITDADAPEIFNLRSSNRIAQHIVRPLMSDPANAYEMVQNIRAAYEKKEMLAWAGKLKSGETIIGTCGLTHIDHHNLRAEIGGEMKPEYWGKGIALEAVQAILDYGLNVLHLHTIEARLLPENKSAIHIIEQLGFKKEGHLKDFVKDGDSFRDLAIYSLISERKS